MNNNSNNFYTSTMTELHQTKNLTPSFRPQVYLVGAGCHDVSWLTIKAARTIEEADILIYDDLIDPSIVSLSTHAKKIYRGKRGHMKSADQAEINSLLVQTAKEGRKVVRLKGGDPMIFGRGMEEIEYLEQNGIDVRVIPGISSFYGIPAKEQFGLTRRPEAGQFMVLTAHRATTERSFSEWQQIAAFQGTRVFLMGMSEIESIATHLIEGGLDPLTPSAILTSPVFTLTESVKAPLANLARKAEEAGLKSPGIILIGGSVNSYIPKPKIRIGLTSSDVFSNKLIQRLPVCFQYARLLENVYTNHETDLSFLLKLKNPWLVFSSIHGVECFFALLRQQHIDMRQLAGFKFAVIGSGSAEELEKHGIYADWIGEGNSRSLANILKNELEPNQILQDIVLFQSDQALPVLADTLNQVAKVRFVPLYGFSCKPARAIEANVNYDYLVLASRTAAKAWINLATRPVVKSYVCLSDDIARVIENGIAHSRILVAGSSSPQGILTCILEDHPEW